MTCMMQGLTVKDMEELRDDIKMYLDSDRATPTRVQYWEVFFFNESFFSCIQGDSCAACMEF